MTPPPQEEGRGASASGAGLRLPKQTLGSRAAQLSWQAADTHRLGTAACAPAGAGAWQAGEAPVVRVPLRDLRPSQLSVGMYQVSPGSQRAQVGLGVWRAVQWPLQEMEQPAERGSLNVAAANCPLHCRLPSSGGE